MPLIELGGKGPRLGRGVFIASTAYVIGDVELGDYVSIWPYAVVRGDTAKIVIGEYSNVQDGAVIHADPEYPVVIGRGVSIGHRAIVHGAKVGDEVIVGMGSVILNGAEVGSGSIIGAGAVVTQGMKIPPGSIAVGVPAKVIRQVSNEDLEAIRRNYRAYVDLVKHYLESGVKL